MIKKVLFSSHKYMEEIINNFEYKKFLIAFGVVYVINIFATLISVTVDPTNDLTLIQGFLAGTVGIFIGLALAVILIATEVFLIHLFAKFLGSSITPNKSLKVYILALVPILFYTIFSSITTLGISSTAIFGAGIYSIVNLLISCIIIPLAIIFTVWRFYVLINAIKTEGELDTGNSLIVGCVPSLIIYSILAVIVVAVIILAGAAVMSSVGY